MKRIVIVGLIAILIALTFLLVHQVLRHEIVKYPEIFFDGFIPPIKGTPVSSTAEKVTILISSQTYPLSSASNQAIAFISVNSVCEKSLEANLVRISIAAIVDAKTASEAVSTLAEKVESIVSKLESLGIARDQIYTSHFSLGPIYDYQQRPPKLVGYRAQHVITVTVSDKTLAARIIDEASMAGADRINIAFTVSKDVFERTYKEALREAVRKAYDKALVIAKALNATLGAVLEVTEKSYLTYIPIRGAVFKAAEKVSTEIYETKATISASVTLKVELVQG